MSRAEVLKVADVVRKQSRRSLEKLEEAAAKRAETLALRRRRARTRDAWPAISIA